MIGAIWALRSYLNKMKLLSNKREVLAKLMCQMRLPSVLHRFGKGRVAILNYHRIYRDDDTLDSAIFDTDVFSCSESQFAAQLDHLQSLGRILSLDEYLYWLEKGEGPGGYTALITFDDGYFDNYEIAFPILKARDTSACFFVPTESIEGRRLGWWDIISYIVKNTRKGSVNIQGAISLQLDIESLGPEAAIRHILGRFKTDKQVDADLVLEELAAACDVGMPSNEVQSGQLMTVENLLEMQGAGMEIGGHGHSHRVLGQLTEVEQKTEIGRCTEMLSQWMGQRTRAFAYPVGLEGSYSDITKSLVNNFGYDVAFNFIEKARAARFNQADRYDIDRLAVYRPTDPQFELLAHGFAL